jgi:hypothetical protein
MSSKQFRRGAQSERQPGQALKAWALAAGLAFLIAPSSASNGGGAGFFGGGDGDSVGSLPSNFSGGPGAGQHGVSETHVDQFGLSLVLAESQIPSLITHAVLENSPKLEPLSSPGLLRVTFAGDTTIVMDRALFEASFVAVQLEIGPAYTGGLLSIKVGQTDSVHAIQPGSLPLHLQQLSWNHLLEQGVEVSGTTHHGESRTLSLSTRGAQNEFIYLQLKD